MLENLDLPTIESILDRHKIFYLDSLIDKGNIVYNSMIIINPLFKEDVETLMHEISHYYIDNILGYEDMIKEDDIERMSLNYLIDHQNIYNYLSNYLNEIKREELINAGPRDKCLSYWFSQ